jgi:hypothetical protein
MIVFDNDIIVLHLYKCAGSSIRWSIKQAGYNCRFTCEHLPIRALPSIYKDFERISFVRNPIKWYKSYYYYYINNNNSKSFDVFVNVLSNNYTLPFDEFILNATDLQNFFKNEKNIQRYKEILISKIMNTYNCWLAFSHEDINNVSHKDFEKTLFDHHFNNIGLNTATVFRIEDGLSYPLSKYFPNVKRILYKNKTNYNNIPPINNTSKELIYNKDIQYFNMFDYSI